MSFYPGPYQNGYVPYMVQASKPAPKIDQPWPLDAYVFMFVAALSLIGIVPIMISRFQDRRRSVQNLHMPPDHVFRSKEELAVWVKFHMGYDVTPYLLDILMTMQDNRHVLIMNGRANGKRTLQEISDLIAERKRKRR